MVRSAYFLAALLTYAAIVGAHSGESLEDVHDEAKIRSNYLRNLKPRNRIASCTSPKNLPSRQKTINRREESVETLRGKYDLENNMPSSISNEPLKEKTEGLVAGFRDFIRAIKSGWNGRWRDHHKRDLADVSFILNNPAMGELPRVDWGSYNLGNTLVLAPSVTEGPYFVSGENIRQNLQDDQDGIPLYLDIQIVDINTCKPIPNAAVDIWQANATGVYGGINSFGNGLNDPRNIQNRALRGIQISDNQGSVRFQTIMPGHYWPRTPHIHVMTSLDSTITDSTIKGGKVAHVAQIFFDQDLNDAVFQVFPYSANDQIRLRNKEDFLVMQGSADEADPVAQYVMLGKELRDGIFGWINFAIDPTKEKKVTPLAECAKEGCKQYEQWWFQKFMLRVLTSPNVYWRKPPIIESRRKDEGVVEHKAQSPATEEFDSSKEL